MNAPAATGWRAWLRRNAATIARWKAIVFAALVLALAGALMVAERDWAGTRDLAPDPETAFVQGSIGTEFIPLAVARVLGDLPGAAEHFQPAGPAAGDWIEQFGFIRRAADDPLAPLPLGLTLSNYRPATGAPSPIPFVGVGCGACHSVEVEAPDGNRTVVIGAGNPALDLIAWGEALRATILATDDPEGPRPGADWIVTADAIFDAYETATGDSLPWFPDKLMISLWLGGFRDVLLADLGKYDEPFGGAALRDATMNPVGPARTAPFRSLTRIVMDRPGTLDNAFSKIATVYHQGWKEWSQFDGSVRNRISRSAMAALTAGATQDNLMQPPITANVVAAATFTYDLAAPPFAQVFPDHAPAADAAARGAASYATHCAYCHGTPDGAGGWTPGATTGAVLPVADVGTDPQRVEFRHAVRAPTWLYDVFAKFPEGHDLRLAEDDMRPRPRGDPADFRPGYLNAPIDGAWVRAPYLHNGSVPTLAQLVGLECRAQAHFRGKHAYDVAAVGLADTGAPAATRYFAYDPSVKGNGNGGHVYPDWPCGDGLSDAQRAELEDLLAYLKTL